MDGEMDNDTRYGPKLMAHLLLGCEKCRRSGSMVYRPQVEGEGHDMSAKSNSYYGQDEFGLPKFGWIPE